MSRRRGDLIEGIFTVGMVLVGCHPGSVKPDPGVNPAPIELRRPSRAPLSPLALLGRDLFFDPMLSASGKMSCSTCHSPAHAWGPPNDLAVQLGGISGHDPGGRAVPSLRYLDQVPEFGIGPESELEDESGLASNGPILQARSGVPGGGVAVPHGGLFWDGRASTLQDQAHGPLFNPVEMANRDTASVVARLRSSRYGAALARLFGAATVSTPGRLLDEAMFAIARFQIEDSTFHPYTSKYDAWLEGKAVLSPAELAGLRAFEDSTRGNCAACHLSRPGPDRRPPTFTDFEYVALAPPRNDAIPANADPNHFDLGLCGPVRTDLRSVPEYCGLFRTPSLRNVARRSVFFHNGVYRSLEEVMRFYNLRAPFPDSIYPRDARGRLRLYDDLPVRYAGNVDTTDTPFDRPLGGRPALTQQEIADIIAFLRTLTDGYRPEGMRAGR